MPQPPEKVLEAFHATSAPDEAVQLGPAWDNGLRVGDVVFARAGQLTSWLAKVREKLQVDGARVARPVLSTDGRYTVAGWKATQFVAGDVARRVDETAQLGLRLDDAAGELTVPHAGTASARTDIFARAEAAAWEETGETYRDLDADAESPLVVGHADLLGTTIYAGANPPTIVDFVPTAAPRPRGFTSALVIVDGLIAGAVDDRICDRFAHIPNLDQLLLRAVAYRRYVNDFHPRSRANTRSYIEDVEELLVSRVSAIM